MSQIHPSSTGALWARFRFSVVGSLLSSPPARGALKTVVGFLAAKTWTHPVTGRHVQFSAVTIERWYYKARRDCDDPVGVLRRAARKDRGKISLALAITERLILQYRDHQDWSYQLHYDNLAAMVKTHPSLGPLRSYSTVKRYMQAHGLMRKPRRHPKDRPGEARAQQRRETREIRSYEATHVGALWHLDFHHGSLKVLIASGQWLRPIALGVLDDHSRLCCHIQWYLSETAADLVHGLSQAIQKRGLPRALLTDNGSAMVAEEVTEGLLRLGIVHERTLPYSPYQNGKSDGTISVEGVRFEIPGRYRHFREVAVRYARWDLGRVDLVDQHSGAILAPIYPLDRSANADGRRALFEPDCTDGPADDSQRKDGQLPPLLKSILEEYSATGMPPAYLPKTPPSQNGEAS